MKRFMKTQFEMMGDNICSMVVNVMSSNRSRLSIRRRRIKGVAFFIFQMNMYA